MADNAQLETYARLLRLSPLQEAPRETSRSDEMAPEASPRRRRRIAGWRSLLLLVVLPVCLAAGYFWILAADRYESETSFVLRTPGRSLPVGIPSNFMPPGGIARAAEDGFIVRDYLESRDAMEWLEKHADLRAAYEKARWDPVWRFPNPFESNSAESLFKHYQRMVTSKFDSGTGVNLLKVEAFTPQDAQRLAASLLDAAEALVNRLNRRSREDTVALASAEVDRMRERTLAAQAALTAFRERERLIDPGQSTLAVLQTIARLALDAAQSNVQINELMSYSANSPQIAQLRNKQAALEAQIVLERQRLAGDAQAIAPRIAEYERLMLEREFAEKALMAAMTAEETARVEALRQHIYLERVAAPGRPDYPAYPWRVIWCLLVLAAACMTWRIWRIVANDAMQHNDL